MTRAWSWPFAGTALALLILTAVVYAPVRNFDFVQVDDPNVVFENPHVVRGLTWDDVGWAFSSDQIAYSSFFMPLVWISYQAEVQIWGVSPGPMHVTNAVLHGLDSVLLLAVLVAATGRLGRSAFVAAMFAVHPLHVESVAWITERKDVLSTLFWLLTMGAYVAYVRRLSRRRYGVMAVCFALGLLAKPMLVTLPCALLLFDLWPLARISVPGGPLSRAAWPAWRRLILEKAPLFALAAAASVVAYGAQHKGDLPFGVRIENAVVDFVAYIGRTMWPADLSIVTAPHEVVPGWQVAGAVVILAGVTWLACRTVRSRPYLLVGWLWYVGVLFPVIGLVQFSLTAVADHFMYVPLVGLLVMAAWGIPDLIRADAVRRIGLGAVAVLAVLACAVAARAQVWYWEDNVALFTRAAEVTLHLDPFTAHMTLGVTLAAEGRTDEAIRHFSAAVTLRPDSAEARQRLAAAMSRRR